ncbi:MAG: hypothetical protein AB7S74_14090 [Hyphomicrobium sp.]
MTGVPAAEKQMDAIREYASFRDPSGFMFWKAGEIYRCIDASYADVFKAADTCGLFKAAVAAGLLLPFEICERMSVPIHLGDHSTVMRPRQINAISYPYEWSFTALKEAALATLRLQLLALEHGFLLKDASAFNIQFVEGAPQFIDHLSFDPIAHNKAWPAYGQFCRHFLGPLLLMSYVDLSFGSILQKYIDGPPLDLVSRLLPRRTELSPSIQIHLHMHARMSKSYADADKRVGGGRTLSARGFQSIANSLLNLIERLEPKDQFTEWGNYYADTNYSDQAFSAKKDLLRTMVQSIEPHTVWDLGGNNGEFSHALTDLAAQIICMDIDPRAVDQNYIRCRKDKISNVLPLIADVTNPPPAVGFANRERPALLDRNKPDLVIALALIHHLAISNNLPLSYIADFLANHTPALIIEFVPKSDSQVRRLLANRPDIFPNYSREGFEAAFGDRFAITRANAIPGTDRTLFVMHRRSGTDT